MVALQIPLDNIDNGATTTESSYTYSSEDGLSVYGVQWEKKPSRLTHTAFSPYVLFSGKHMEIDVLNVFNLGNTPFPYFMTISGQWFEA